MARDKRAEFTADCAWAAAYCPICQGISGVIDAQKNSTETPLGGGASVQVKKRKEDVAEAVSGLHGFCLQAVGQFREDLVLIRRYDMDHLVSFVVVEVFRNRPCLHIV